MKIEPGSRFVPLKTEVNKKFGLTDESKVIVCFIDDNRISVFIDKGNMFNWIEAVMPLPVFAANFSPANIHLERNKAYITSKHFTKEYPHYFNKIIGVG
jgi:hypothetical protein